MLGFNLIHVSEPFWLPSDMLQEALQLGEERPPLSQSNAEVR